MGVSRVSETLDIIVGAWVQEIRRAIAGGGSSRGAEQPQGRLCFERTCRAQRPMSATLVRFGEAAIEGVMGGLEIMPNAVEAGLGRLGRGGLTVLIRKAFGKTQICSDA